jgi:chemosensory pili system protein ChpA (sensor histidine kinase/response regulator)
MDTELSSTFLAEARLHLARVRDPRSTRADRQVAAHGLLGLARLVELPELEPLARSLEQAVENDQASAIERTAGAIERLVARLGGSAVSEATSTVEAAGGEATSTVEAAGGEAAGGEAGTATDATAGGAFSLADQEMLRGFFLEESYEHLESAQRTLLTLARGAAPDDPLAELFRTLHTLKGAAGTVGLGDVSEAAHALEDGVLALQAVDLPIDRETLEPMQAALDALRAMIESDDDGERSELAQAIRSHLDGVHARYPAPSFADARSTAEPTPPPLRVVTPVPQSRSPSAEPIDRRLGERRETDRRSAERQVLRVDVGRVDELMDEVGELVFHRTRVERRVLELAALAHDLGQARGAFRDVLALLRRQDHPLADRLAELDGDVAETARRFERSLSGLHDETESLRRTTTAMQEKLQRVRMMPLRWLYARLERLVHETARAEGKRVALDSSGDATELDKSVVEQIGDPLSQLLRNAVTHGIEPPQLRAQGGKSPEGRVTVAARQRGEYVYLDVADDGRGIDPQLVRERLVAIGRLSAEAAAALGDDDAVGAIFERGFSTRPAPDRHAGRGIGLDVVRESISRLGGTIGVASRPGTGTTFTIRLPLTTAIMQALLFKVGGQVYALPAAHVIESAHAPAPLGRTAMLRGDALPVVDLHLLLGAEPPLDRRRVLVALSFGDRRFAVTCDKLVGPRQIVVKSVGPLLKPLPLYAGATISGAGKVQLILDLATLAAQLGRTATRLHELPPTLPPARPPRILVADDSRSVREAVSLILQAAGYRVDVVPDGWEAWEALQDGAYDLLLTDLEMPRLAGYELIAKVRRDAELRSLPVLVISSRSAAPQRARAEAAGAQGFIAKPINRRVIVDRVADALRNRA